MNFSLLLCLRPWLVTIPFVKLCFCKVHIYITEVTIHHLLIFRPTLRILFLCYLHKLNDDKKIVASHNWEEALLAKWCWKPYASWKNVWMHLVVTVIEFYSCGLLPIFKLCRPITLKSISNFSSSLSLLKLIIVCSLHYILECLLL